MVLKQTEMALRPKTLNDPLEEIKGLGSIECGEEARKHFDIAEGYRNLNHGKLMECSLMIVAIEFLGACHMMRPFQLIKDTRLIRHIPQRDQIRSSPLPGSIRGETGRIHSVRLP